MKKIITLTALFISIGFIVNAQEDNRESFQIGARIGGSYSNVYDAKGEEFDADAKFGFTGGAFMHIPIGPVFGIQPEFMLNQKGFKGGGSILGSSYNFERTTTFLDVPILFAVKPSEFLTLLVGPQYSFLLKQKDVFNSAIVNTNQEQEFENENVRKNILGLVVGLDVNVQHFVLGARMGWDVQANKGDGTSTTPRYKNVCAQFTIGYRFF